ncbi:MAG: hypothetical protein OXF83_09700 [Anaerolineaceae bacterium]|nr:hypothetical protein [Anaerolineaceae bacterium]
MIISLDVVAGARYAFIHPLAEIKSVSAMAANAKAARDYLYAHGTLWERALYAHHFEGGSLARLHACLATYQNDDGGYGHAFEHDIRCPDSHPLALEFLLSVLRICAIPAGDLLAGVATWLERQLLPDGSLRNPPAVLEHPHAPWWQRGGQDVPIAIVGNLHAQGQSTPVLLDAAARWAQAHMNPSQIRANEWLFLCYRPYEYYFALPESDFVRECRAATLENIVFLAEKMPPEQTYSLFFFATDPASPATQALPQGLLEDALERLYESQQDDGSWPDQHGLAHWYPYTTIYVLLTLRRFGMMDI